MYSELLRVRGIGTGLGTFQVGSNNLRSRVFGVGFACNTQDQRLDISWGSHLPQTTGTQRPMTHGPETKFRACLGPCHPGLHLHPPKLSGSRISNFEVEGRGVCSHEF